MKRRESVFGILLALFLLSSCVDLENHPLEPKDLECLNMQYNIEHFVPSTQPNENKQFEAEIPRIIHEARLNRKSGSEGAEESAWKEYCAATGCEHRVWTEQTPELDKVFGENNLRLFKQLCEEQLYESAEDVLRYEVLRTHGGVFVGKTIRPPRKEGVFVPLGRLIPLRGIHVLVGKKAVQVANTALYPNLEFLASCKDHPILRSTCKQVGANVETYRRKTGKHVRRYTTGNVLFAVLISGTIGVIQPNYLKQYGMLEVSK